MGLYVLSLPISLVMIEIICILCLIIIIKSEVWTITHCLGFGHETMVSAVCLYIFIFFSYYQVLMPFMNPTKIFSLKIPNSYVAELFIALCNAGSWISVDSLGPSDAYIRWKTKPPWVQNITCRQICATPLSEPMMGDYDVLSQPQCVSICMISYQ